MWAQVVYVDYSYVPYDSYGRSSPSRNGDSGAYIVFPDGIVGSDDYNVSRDSYGKI